MTSFLIFASSLFLVWFCSNFVQRCFLVLQTKKNCWEWLQSDVTVTSSIISRIRFGLSTLKRMYCHGNINHFFLQKFCAEILLIISKNTLKFCKDWLRNNVTVTSLLSWLAPLRISAVSEMWCHGNMNNLILLIFSTKVQFGISNKITKLCWEWLRNDVTVTSLLFCRTWSFVSALSRKCCHGNSILKLLLFNKFLYIFRKSHQIWLN